MDKEDIISKLYDIYIEKSLDPDEKNKKITTELMDKLEELDSDLTYEQMREIEEIIDDTLTIREHIIKQAFIGGYKLGVRMMVQSIYKKKRNNLI
ncbi:MAG: hypothetical protein J6I85_01285 [Clostridia bacterium]|nr:hypothetical protein [Clostridia bacterium]